MFFFVWFFIPETKGLSLEKMDDLFGVTELAKAADEEAGSRHGSAASAPAREIGLDGKEMRAEHIERK